MILTKKKIQSRLEKKYICLTILKNVNTVFVLNIMTLATFEAIITFSFTQGNEKHIS